jgi:hypothetical protein
MTGPITLPAHIGGFQELDSTPARAEAFATDLRTVTVGVKNAESSTRHLAAPDWQGAARDSHDHAATRFVQRIDTISAALDGAVTAADRFEERIYRLHARRLTVDAERIAVNRATAQLALEIRAAVDDSREAEFRGRAARLLARAEAVGREIAAWTRSYTAAEDAFVAALATVDTLPEGQAAATAPGRPDVPALQRQLGRLAGDPAALAAWWRRLSRADREALTTAAPGLVGRAGGLPCRDRDEANRASLGNTIDYLRQREQDGELTTDEAHTLHNATVVQQEVDSRRDDVDPATGRELGYLLLCEPSSFSGDGGVAYSVGDPDAARHVSAFVPGFSSTTDSMHGYLADLDRLRDAADPHHTGDVATVFWLGYDAPSGSIADPTELPDLANVLTPFDARAGGHHFADFVQGLHASDTGAAAHFTAIGHSYGSTTVGWALHDGMQVDDGVLVGSPGVPGLTAADLTHAHVWVGSMDDDPVSLLGLDGRPDRGELTGVLGTDPAQASFGGTRFHTGDGSLQIQDLLANHSGYFQGDSLANMAHIVAGEPGAVTTEDPRSGFGYLTLPELLAAASANRAGHELWDPGGGWLVHHVEQAGAGLLDALGSIPRGLVGIPGLGAPLGPVGPLG